MRALLLIAGAALALGGCGHKGQTDTAQNADESLTVGNIVSNDVTAIDAVTGDAANMAADVDTNYGGVEENGATATLNEVSARPKAGKPVTSKRVSETNRTAATTTTNAE